MTAEANPRQVFERLFGAGAARGTRGQRRAAAGRNSVPSSILCSKTRTRWSGGSGRAIRTSWTNTSPACANWKIASHRAEQLGDVKDPMVPTPDGIPVSYEEHMQLMYDIMVLAFQTDSTRVATLLLAHDGSNRSFAEIGIPEGHHDLSHHFNNAEKIQKVSDIDLWYVKQFSKFLQKLQDTKDVDGNSLLHNSMIVYGGGNADGNRHTHVNLPVVLAGAGGGTLKPGRFVKHGSKPLTNLFLSLADRMGVDQLERFGDSSGRLANV